MSIFRRPGPAPSAAPAAAPRRPPLSDGSSHLRLGLAFALVLVPAGVLALWSGHDETLNWGWAMALATPVTAVLGGLVALLGREGWRGEVGFERTPFVLPMLLAPLAAWSLVGSVDHVLGREPPVTQVATIIEAPTGSTRSYEGTQLAGTVVVMLRGPRGFERRALVAHGWMHGMQPGGRLLVDLQRGALGLWTVARVQPAETGVASVK